MRLLVFQHIDCEHPGSLRRFLRQDEIEWDAVELDAGEAIPSLDDYDALGGTCGPQHPAEIGILEIAVTKAGQEDSLFEGLPVVQKCLQWHSVCVEQIPENTTVLANSDICEVQAMRVGDNAWSMQYHVEVEEDTVDNWGAVPAYRDALEATLGAEGLPNMKLAADQHIDAFLQCSEKIYHNFMKAIG